MSYLQGKNGGYWGKLPLCLRQNMILENNALTESGSVNMKNIKTQIILCQTDTNYTNENIFTSLICFIQNCSIATKDN